MSFARIHPDDLAALADLVAERLAGNLDHPHVSLVDAHNVAAQFGLTAAWVRENADRLGAIRLGDGPRPRLRFDPATVATALKSQCSREEPDGPGARSRQRVQECGASRPAAEDPGLLPLRTLKSSSRNKLPGRCANTPGQATRSSPSPRSQPTRDSESATSAAERVPRASTERSRYG
jgi:hypothetical protein